MDWQDITTCPKGEVLLYFPQVVGSAHPSNNKPAMYKIGHFYASESRRASFWAPLTPPGPGQ